MNRIIAKFRAAADRLQRDIDKPQPYKGMNPTRKRMQAWTQHARNAGEAERLQFALRYLADWYERGGAWPPLAEAGQGVLQPWLREHEPPQTTVLHAGAIALAEDRLRALSAPDDVRAILGPYGFGRDLVRDVARYMLLTARQTNPEEERRLRIERGERELLGVKIPGFFPTPVAIARQMVEAAAIEPGMRVLEPSAGSGRIADAIQEYAAATGNVNLWCIECVPRLVDLLQLKGHRTEQRDFLTLAPREVGPPDRLFDRIVMNPPFEDGQDAEHVMHAYELLAPGGRLVSLLSPGPFYRNDRKARDFRAWIDTIIGDEQVDWREGMSRGQQDWSFKWGDDCELWWSTLPENSFRESGTGAQVRMLLIDKPASLAAAIAAAPAASLPRVAF